MGQYIERIGDAELAERLSAAGAVLIEGPRACGKTETARRMAASTVLLDVDENARSAMSLDPSLVLNGDTPRLIDEWQIEPRIWNHVRRTVDLRQSSGQFILTGSAVPADDITRHTGAGRISRMRLRTLSLLEMGVSNGKVSLGGLLQGDFAGCAPVNLTAGEVTEIICRGGWPGDLNRSLKACQTARADYLDEIRRADISRPDGISRDPENVGKVLRSLARNTATTVSARTLAADVGEEGQPLNDGTVREYLTALGRLMVVEKQPAWSPNLRSKAVLRKSPKRHFIDPSLAAAAIGFTPDRLLKDLKYLGFLFESMVFRDLSVYARGCDARVFHYLDNTLEVDAVVQNRAGNWCALEIKLGTGQLDAAARTLLRFRDRLDPKRNETPGMLGVITSSGYAYRRPDGVLVIPVGALGP